MTSQAALKSKDLTEVKKARAVIKGQLTVTAKRLESIFSKKAENDDFDHKSISKTEAKNLQAKLNENFELFQKLHLKCCELRDVNKDAVEEDKSVLKDEEYSEEITSKVYPLEVSPGLKPKKL